MSTSFDELARACTESQAYPSNLLRPQGLRSLADQHRRLLKRESQHLFVSSNKQPHVDVLEAVTGDRCIRQSRWNSMVDMKEHIGTHLLHKVEDPQIRHVFLSADSSAAPLNCSYEMFLYLCTYHQIPFEFVEMMYSFGHNGPLLRDFHHTHLLQQIDRQDSSGPNIQILGRSGYETRVGYKLSAMEMSEPTNKWTLRQTAAYHSLDLKTGKSFWLTTKANDVISRRVIKASKGSGGAISTIPPTPQAALSNALQTHLIMTDWCSEGWQFYINSLEMEVRGTLTKIMGTSIPDEISTLDPTPALTRDPLMKRLAGMATQYSHAQSRPSTWWTRYATGKGGARKSYPLLPLTANHNFTGLGSSMQQETGLQGSDDEEQLKNTKARLHVLSSFSLTEMQRLSATALKLREARMVMSLNVAIITEMKEYYLSLFEAPDLPQAMKDECAIVMHEFKRRLSALERFIESECMRCDTLISQLKDGKTMLSLILDAQSKEIERLYAMNTHHLAESMHDTERFMWMITVVTLIFLPGTFVATVFSTSLFGDDLIDGIEPKLFTNSSWLFASICLPLMAITLIVWAIVLQHQKARRM